MSESNKKIIDIIPLVKNYFPKNALIPNVAQSLSNVDEHLEMILQDAEMIWGSDSVGGLAYFGKSEDILNVQEQVKNYLNFYVKKNSSYDASPSEILLKI